jgi:protein-tyrosine phosphatase
MRHLVAKAGLSDRIVVESAGTSGYHLDEPPDRRATAAAKRRGIDIGNRGKQFKRDDLARFDYVLAMDQDNLEDLLALDVQKKHDGKIRLLRSFDPASPPGAKVPDPYYGGDDGFDHVLDLCTAACTLLLQRIREEHEL